MKFANSVFGAKLKGFREELGLKQRELAEMVGVEIPTVSCWESGKFMPEDEKFALICKKLKRAPSEFFGDPKGFNFSAASDFFAKISSLSPDRRGLVLMLIHDDPSYLADNPSLVRAVSNLLKDE